MEARASGSASDFVRKIRFPLYIPRALHGCYRFSAKKKDRISFAFKADVIHGVLKRNEQKLVRSVTFPFRYIADPIGLEINAITDTIKSTLTYISKLTVKTVTKLF